MTSFSRLEMISRVFFPLNISNGSTIEVTLQLIVAVSANSSSKLFHVCIASSSIISHVKFHKTTKRRPSTFYKRLQNCSNQASIEIQRGRFWRANFFLNFTKNSFLRADTHSGRCSKLTQTFWNEINLVESRGLWKRGWRGMEIAPRYVKRTPSAEKKGRIPLWKFGKRGRKRLARTNLWPVWSS